MQSQLSDQINKTLTGMVALGDPRNAINLAKEIASHVLLHASEIILKSFDDQDKSCELLLIALKLAPKDVVVYERLVTLYSDLGQYDSVVIYAQGGLKIKETPILLYNLGHAQRMTNKLDDALITLRRLLEIDPMNEAGHIELSDVLLVKGQFPEGLMEAEWKFKAYDSGRKMLKRFKQPIWNGECLQGRKILVFNDQGRGDSINNIRYVSNLKKLGAFVIVEVIKDFVKLYRNNPEIDLVIAKQEENILVPKPGEKKVFNKPVPLPEHDYAIACGSLPLRFDPNLESVMSGYLTPKVDYSDKLKEGLALLRESDYKVGIVWAGNPWHLNDRCRSCPLRHFQVLAQPGVQLVSLQLGNMKRSWPVGDKALWDGYNGDVNIIDLMEGSNVAYTDLAPYVTDFNDTALILRNLDLVITVDTAVAHLAGAMGVNVWLLLPQACEWRWQRDWYVSMRKYKQSSNGDWEGLLAKVGSDLAGVSEHHRVFQ